MNRFSKILAIVLLLALLTSVLGIFSAFAEDATELKPTVVYDMDAQKSVDVAEAGSTERDGKNVKTPTVSKKTDGNGETYWLFETNVKAGATIGDGDSAYFNMYPSVDAVLIDHSVGGSKNTDFFVVDFDLASDDVFIGGLYFNMRYKTASNGNASNSPYQPGFYGNGYDGMYVTTDNSGTGYAAFPTVENDNEWVNVTLVYDFRGTTPANWKAHVYIDGYYASTLKAPCVSTSCYLDWIRFTFPKTATADYQTTKVRNLTQTIFPVGWNGDLAASGKLAKYAVTLNEIDELAYCLEGTNAKRNDVIATITRGEKTIDVTSFADLDANFVAGDVVDLKADIGAPLLVNAENVTFNANGYNYSLVDTSAVDFTTAKYVVVNYVNRAVTSSGDAEAFKTLALPADGSIVVLLEDLERTLVHAKNQSSTVASGKHVTFDLNGHEMVLNGSARMFNTADGTNGTLRFMNGKLKYSGAGDLTMMNQSNALIFENLDFTVIDGTFIDQRDGIVVVKDSTVDMPNYGTEKAPAYSLFTSLKGDASKYSAFEIINSDFTAHKNIANLSNTASSGKRYGGLNTRVNIVDSSIVMTDVLTTDESEYMFTLDAHCVQQGIYIDDPEGEAYSSGKNKFNVDFNIVNSTLSNDGYPILYTNLYSLTYNSATTTYPITDSDGDGVADKAGTITLTGNQIYKAKDMDIDVDINLVDSDIAASYITNQHKTSTALATAVPYKYDVALNVDGASKLDVSKGVMYSADDEAEVVSSLTMANGAKLTTDNIRVSGKAQDIENLTLGNGNSVIAHTSDPNYGYVVTSDYRTGSYAVKDHKGEKTIYEQPFNWNGNAETDPVNIGKVVALPEATNLYSYTAWANEGDNYTTNIVPGFKLSANLTALTDFYLNVYLNGDIDKKDITMTVNGKTVADLQAITIDGVNYLKAEDQVIKGITPEGVETNYPVTVTFEGGFGETVDLTANVSVAQHLIKALAGTNEKGVAFAQSIINYVVAANNFAGKNGADSLKDYATTIATPEYTNPKWGGELKGVTAEINLGDSARWVFTVEADKTYSFTYAGVTRSFTADKDGKITIGMRAVDLLGDVVITCDGKTSTVNLAGYYKELAGNTAAQAVVNALYNYSEAAQAYAKK